MTTLFTYTSDFREEFEAETASLLRERFRVFLWSNLAVYLFSHFFLAIMAVIFVWMSRDPAITQTSAERLRGIAERRYGGISGVISIALLALLEVGIVLWYVARSKDKKLDSIELIKQSQYAFFVMSAVDVGAYVFGASAGFPFSVMVSHAWACVLLPWTPRQAARPLIAVLTLNAATILLLSESEWGWRIGIALLSVLALAPGYVISKLKHHRRLDQFKLNFLQSRYGQLRRELTDARKIHESLFPKPQQRGPLGFDFRYEPMRQIGGDYLYARFSPPGFHRPHEHPHLSVLLLDVTGHGIAAALTVNRLYGEVERQFAENPDASPGEVLRGLNKYVHLTLASHSVFATALCLRIDPNRNEIEYASGGHPPAFLRGVDGTLHDLPSTALVLGACADADFDPEPQKHHFGPGDAVIAYTDGAIEARNPSGRMLGVIGLQRILASTSASQGLGMGGWAQTIVTAVETHRQGPAKDDTLVVEIVRSLRIENEVPARTRTRDGIAAGV
jgi:serine phosphatase RsbU (regulator of sigma subunit)